MSDETKPEEPDTPPPVPDKPKRLKITSRLKEQEVDIEGPDGVDLTYTVKEMTGPQRDNYLKEQAKKAPRYENGKLVQHQDFANFQADLIKRCLFLNGRLVGEGVVNAMSASAQEALFAVCQEVNSIPKEVADFLKRDEQQKKD